MRKAQFGWCTMQASPIPVCFGAFICAIKKKARLTPGLDSQGKIAA